MSFQPVFVFPTIIRFTMMSPDSDRPAIRRITVALFLAQCLSAAAYSTTATINNLAFIELSGAKWLAGVPLTMVLMGSAFANYRVGGFVQRRGRRAALVLGGVLGAVGALLGGVGIAISSLLIYVPAMLLLGSGRGILDQSRYAAAEVYPASQRARAISIVVWGATVGSVLGASPLVVTPVTNWARALNLNAYSGPLFSTSFFYASVALVLFVLLAVDLIGISKRVAAANPISKHLQDQPNMPRRSFWDLFRSLDSRAAVIAMICGQAAMVFAMGVIGVHMHDHGHPLNDISIVTTVHVLGMFAFSPLVGVLGDSLGRKPMIAIGAALLGGGCILAPLSLNTPWIAFAQFFVGFGWSCCYVSGSALLTDALGSAERARMQSTNDAAINISSAIGSLSGGVLLSALGFGAVSAIGLVVAVIPLFFVLQAGVGRTGKLAGRTG
jgi:MFS family permease